MKTLISAMCVAVAGCAVGLDMLFNGRHCVVGSLNHFKPKDHNWCPTELLTVCAGEPAEANDLPGTRKQHMVLALLFAAAIAEQGDTP